MSFRLFSVHHTHHVDAELMAVLLSIKESLMALSDDLTALVSQIDTATNLVADRLAALTAQIKNSMTDDEVSSLKTSLQGEIDKLKAMGQNPENPIPA